LILLLIFIVLFDRTAFGKSSGNTHLWQYPALQGNPGDYKKNEIDSIHLLVPSLAFGCRWPKKVTTYFGGRGKKE
jgi:hypothetical protein